MKDTALGKKVSALVEEQLQYCRSLRRADMLSAISNVATDEQCLKQANSLIMLLKADIRVLNACAARFLPPSENNGAVDKPAGSAEVAASAYSVEKIERILRRFRLLDTGDSGSRIKTVAATNQLIVIRERLQAGLSTRLLELNKEMDKEFGATFVEMESYFRTEIDTQAKADAEHCSACARSFVELCYKFQVMVHACRGLRAAKEGLNQTVLLKALREERDSLERRSEEAETELKKIHHSYTDMMTPEVAVGLENRQRHKLVEQEADLGRQKLEIATLKRDHDRLLAENGRFSDALGELQSLVQANKDQHRRELEWLHPKAAAAETRAVEIEGILDQMNLRLSLFGSSQKRASEEINDLKAQLAMARANGSVNKLGDLQREAGGNQVAIKRLQADNSRQSRLVTLAMSARAEAVSSYSKMKQESEDVHRRFKETQGENVLLEAKRDLMISQLQTTEGCLASAQEREAKAADELRKLLGEMSIKAQENAILEERLGNQEMELRDFSNLQKKYDALEASRRKYICQLATASGALEEIKLKAMKQGISRELGL